MVEEKLDVMREIQSLINKFEKPLDLLSLKLHERCMSNSDMKQYIILLNTQTTLYGLRNTIRQIEVKVDLNAKYGKFGTISKKESEK